ncbi:MAG: hypothetical protein A3K10_06750 [Bacteroidetes bacterium RIFCSPLOWO2_12_FULL_31_6]|nr:MAG: hypothetical protein A3K10_06750 [Bacteroidetes bacterium RIFCSPLOWO2_12_FULL_31_6]
MQLLQNFLKYISCFLALVLQYACQPDAHLVITNNSSDTILLSLLTAKIDTAYLLKIDTAYFKKYPCICGSKLEQRTLFSDSSKKPKAFFCSNRYCDTIIKISPNDTIEFTGPCRREQENFVGFDISTNFPADSICLMKTGKIIYSISRKGLIADLENEIIIRSHDGLWNKFWGKYTPRPFSPPSDKIRKKISHEDFIIEVSDSIVDTRREEYHL